MCDSRTAFRGRKERREGLENQSKQKRDAKRIVGVSVERQGSPTPCLTVKWCWLEQRAIHL